MYDEALSVTDFLKSCNDFLSANFEETIVEGEVSEFKISQNRWVFFSLKDEKSTLGCFLYIGNLNLPLEDGMKIRVTGYPKVTDWGKFSFTVQKITPVGEGSIKKAFEFLKRKLEQEGLFDPRRKRKVPKNPKKLGVISSTTAAGYADFCKILNARWGGIDVKVCHTQVQGMAAPGQIIKAFDYLNEQTDVEAIAIIRGGGSKDDLSCFNDEDLARAIARSRVPVITGIGHEVDESIADLVADARASTPSNCAELLTSDRQKEAARIEKVRLHARSRILLELTNIYQTKEASLGRIRTQLSYEVNRYERQTTDSIQKISARLRREIEIFENRLVDFRRVLKSCNPETILGQGYAILRGKISPGSALTITTSRQEIEAEVKKVKERNKDATI